MPMTTQLLAMTACASQPSGSLTDAEADRGLLEDVPHQRAAREADDDDDDSADGRRQIREQVFGPALE
jgi:hypothetical protein